MEIVAEISGNHGGSLDNARRLIRAAIDAGADAVKFQCFDPERLALKRAGMIWEGQARSAADLHRIYMQTQTPREWFPHLIACCGNEIPWLSSVFDPDDVAFLETLNCPRYKISAYEMLDGDLINAVVATGKPIIMSVRARPGVTVLLSTEYEGELTVPGLSDHTWGNEQAIHAAAGGAPMIERHICLPDVKTPDSAFSLTPDQFKTFVHACREARTPRAPSFRTQFEGWVKAWPPI